MGKLKRFFYLYKNIFLSAALLAAVIFAFIIAVNNTAGTIDQSAEATQYNAIKKAAVQCYALEGFFPPDVDYLIQNYGVIVDNEKFIVRYEADGENLMPNITVIKSYTVK